MGDHRYTVFYEGYLFDGDVDGWNAHGYDDWSEVEGLINFYGDSIIAKDNIFNVVWQNGAWE